MYVLLLYILSLFPFRLFTKNVEKSPSILPHITLIIPVYNEGTVISEKIDNTNSISYPIDKINIIIVSDGSTDNTNYIVRTKIKKLSHYTFLSTKRSGKSSALNTALANLNSATQIVLFTDANTLIAPETINKMVLQFENSRVGCVSARLEYTNNNTSNGNKESLYWKYENFIKKYESKFGCLAGANGALYSIRRNLVEFIPMGTVNDDFFLSMKVLENNYDCIYVDSAVVFEEEATSIVSEFKRHVRDCTGHYIALMQFWRMLNPLRGFSFFAFISHRVFRWIGPVLLLSLFVTNIFLISFDYYRYFFLMQLSFYFLALIGFFFRELKLPAYLYAPYYFCNLNCALLFGIFTFMFNKDKYITWEPIRN